MLCEECSKINLTFRKHGEDHEITYPIRRYSNLWSLRESARVCDFCELVCNHPAQLTEQTFPVCRALWGQELYLEALKETPIHVRYTSHAGGCNIFFEYEVDVGSREGYHQGPPGADISDRFDGVYIHKDCAQHKILPTRWVEPNPSEQTMSAQSYSWYQHCSENHEQCVINSSRPVLLPTRLIDVSRTANGYPAPIIHLTQSGSMGTYLALSYSWGHSPTVLLLEDNLSKFTSEGISYQQLPKTFRDAISLARTLGQRYLWIDALCIIQDSKADWDKESAHMYDTFSGASVVIRAASGRDTEHGLFNNSGRAPKQDVELKGTISSDTQVRCFVRQIMNRRDPLNRRCWALQEFRLASRFLTFGTSEMTWDCQQAQYSESGTPTTDVHIAGFRTPFRVRSDSKSRDTIEKSFLARAQKGITSAEIWQELVAQYSARQLTLSKDKLPAISGLAIQYAKNNTDISKDRYLAGLWQSQLPGSLLWYIGRGVHDAATKAELYRAPTWSWAYIDHFRTEWLGDASEDTYATVRSATVTPLGKDHYGQVKAAELTLQGTLMKLSLGLNPTYGTWNAIVTSTKSIDSSATEPLVDTEKVTGRIIFDLGDPEFEDTTQPHYVYCLRITKHAGLVIEPCKKTETGQESQYWQRVGVYEWWPEEIHLLPQVDDSVITLV